MTELNIMSVREMIDNSFGDSDINTVNFKLIQAVLFILARQLQVLERHVAIQTTKRRRPETSISVTELKIHSKSKKKTGKPGDQKASSSDTKSQTHLSSQDRKKDRPLKSGTQAVKDEPPKKMTEPSTPKVSTQKSSVQKPSAGITVSEKTSTEKSSTDKSSTDKSSTTKSSTDKSSTAKSSTEKSSTDKSSTDKSSTEKSTTEKSSSGKSSSGKSTTEKSSSDKSVLRKPLTESVTDKNKGGKVNMGGSEKRRRGQKSDEDEDDILNEKLLVVSRKASRIDADNYQRDTGADHKTVATQQQYKAIVAAIRELQALFNKKDNLHIQNDKNDIRVDLQKRTSMTDPMAAVNMSARLEIAEQKLAEIMPIATELAKKTPGIDFESAFDDTILKQKDIKEWGPPGLSSQTPPPISKSAAFKQPHPRSPKEQQKPKTITLELSDEESEEDESEYEVEPDSPDIEMQVEDEQGDKVPHDEFELYLKEVSDAVLKKISAVNSSCTSCEASYRKLVKVDEKLEEAMKLGDRYSRLDFSVEIYADEVNALDSKLGTQMTEYQDALTQMQYDLEGALDILAEALASPTEDAAAIADLNQQFSSFQLDVNNTAQRQEELKTLQSAYAVNLSQLMRKIEKLQVTKSTREEVLDALSDKAGIAALNGMVAIQQFDAVSGDFEKRIGASYEQFNNKEIVWQKAIDDLIRTINEKADYVQMARLNSEIQKYIDMLRASLDEMLDQVGELNTNPTTKKLERFDNCLSCGTRVHNDNVEDLLENMLSRPPVAGTKSTDIHKEDTVRKICVPGQPVPHPTDPRSIICQRYCGAPVTSNVDGGSLFKVGTTELNPAQSTIVGSDGKVYKTDVNKKPCAPCNIKKLSPQISKASSKGPVSLKGQISSSVDTILSDVEIPIHEKQSKTSQPSASLYQSISVKQPVFSRMDTINSESEAPEDEKKIAS